MLITVPISSIIGNFTIGGFKKSVRDLMRNKGRICQVTSQEWGHSMTKLVLLRHGESIWNMESRFAGWTDVDLSERGAEEAKMAVQVLKEVGLVIDLAFTSELRRAIRTLWPAPDEMDLVWIPVIKSWGLNERHYGALQGLKKSDSLR